MSDVMEQIIRRVLADKGMRPEAATAAAQAASKTIKGSTASYYMSLLKMAEESEEDNERIQTGCR